VDLQWIHLRRIGIYRYGYIHGYPRKICGCGCEISYPRQPCWIGLDVSVSEAFHPVTWRHHSSDEMHVFIHWNFLICLRSFHFLVKIGRLIILTKKQDRILAFRFSVAGIPSYLNFNSPHSLTSWISPLSTCTCYIWLQSRTWGMAYHVVGSAMVRTCLERLGLRECHLGGYNLHRVTFTESHSSHAEHLRALVFIASPSNHLYLGPASVDELARQVMSARSCLDTSGTSDTGTKTILDVLWYVLWYLLLSAHYHILINNSLALFLTLTTTPNYLLSAP